ncbi:MAG: folate family ECF transporter S component [Clostridia bacterium]|nr:folate family ECF transporter S component [Clostridia bacterium]
MFNSKKITTKELCLIAMFIALTVILGYVSGFLRVGNISKISVSFVSVYLAAAAFGPWIGGFVAAMADFISFLANPTGMYLWQLTVVEFIFGFLFGVFFSRKKQIRIPYLNLNVKILIYSVIQFAINMVIKTLILQSVGFVSADFYVAFIQRLPGCMVAFVLNFVVLNLFERFVPGIIRVVRK